MFKKKRPVRHGLFIDSNSMSPSDGRHSRIRLSSRYDRVRIRYTATTQSLPTLLSHILPKGKHLLL